MKEIGRRDFMKTVTIGGAILGFGSVIFHKPLEALANGKYDIGQCKSVTIKCVSEVGWLDNNNLITSINSAGGQEANQWGIPWDPKNAVGCCSLIDMETLNGSHHKFLLDTGRNHQYMESSIYE